MDKSWKILEREGFCTKGQFKMFNKMLAKIKKQSEEVVGWHGTSGKIGKIIKDQGFKNFRCQEGGYGVYFWDEDCRDKAIEIARERMSGNGDKEFALIKAKIKNPNPDLLMGRPQWLAEAEKIKILSIEFFKK